jgi:hypothetical protein
MPTSSSSRSASSGTAPGLVAAIVLLAAIGVVSLVALDGAARYAMLGLAVVAALVVIAYGVRRGARASGDQG